MHAQYFAKLSQAHASCDTVQAKGVFVTCSSTASGANVVKQDVQFCVQRLCAQDCQCEVVGMNLDLVKYALHIGL